MLVEHAYADAYICMHEYIMTCIVYACMYVCMYVYMYVRITVCMYKCMCVCTDFGISIFVTFSAIVGYIVTSLLKRGGGGVPGDHRLTQVTGKFLTCIG